MQGCIANGSIKVCKSAQSLICEKGVRLRHFFFFFIKKKTDMEIKGKVHCLFEQHGTFKNEFMKLGITAWDYDIQNNYGETDYVVDIFKAIEDAYDGRDSLFDNIAPDDLVIAFFPCIYFCQGSMTQFSWSNINYRNIGDKEKSDKILNRLYNRTYFYSVAIKMLTIAKVRGLRLIMENPWTQTYLRTFVVRPALIDWNRTRRGDYFVKPTAYWYINCLPTVGYSMQLTKVRKRINNCKKASYPGLCSDERSIVSSDYARNFICDFILGHEQSNTMKSLFD